MSVMYLRGGTLLEGELAAPRAAVDIYDNLLSIVKK